jgi:uncharacterized damage-inducible protein DinB
MKGEVTDLRDSILGAWRTTNRANVLLVQNLPAPLWAARVPGEARRTVRSIAGHLHNSRCRWIKTLGSEHGIPVPPFVDLHRVNRRELVAALQRSSRGIEALLVLGLDAGGQVPPSKGYVWRNLPLDVGHVLSYFVAHEAHHRGQLLMLARQLGHRVPRKAGDGLWQWMTRERQR